MTDYVLGFLFSTSLQDVALIQKIKPEWQKGKLNGIGGKVEDTDFSTDDAMIREFHEETGVKFLDWECFGSMVCTNSWRVALYRGVSNVVYDVKTTTDERVSVYSHKYLIGDDSIPNLKWLIPAALDRNKIFLNVTFPPNSD
jgi:8-oxo-dGTP diphosphatase